jgi:hypothetical protein
VTTASLEKTPEYVLVTSDVVINVYGYQQDLETLVQDSEHHNANNHVHLQLVGAIFAVPLCIQAAVVIIYAKGAVSSGLLQHLCQLACRLWAQLVLG